MSRYRYAVGARDAHITTLRLIIGVLVMICAGLWWGWQNAPKDLTIHNPPDLRSGSVRKWWEVPPSTVYAFSFYVWQQINRWPANGQEDYRRNLYSFAPFITSSCQSELYEDFQARDRRHELQGRVRGVYEIPGRGYREASNGPGSVRIVNQDQWIVNLDLAIDERYAGTEIREVFVRYPLRVIRADVDPQRNPWGLQIDCLAQPAERLGIPDQEGNS